MPASARHIIVPAALALALGATPAFAALELVEQNSKTVGATSISWDSSFRDLSYVNAATITMEVNWSVDAGTASFNNFRLRNPPRFTPKGPDPANGELIGVQLLQNSDAQGSEGTVEVTFRFTELHCDAERDREIGNAHFSLDLAIDQNGDGVTDGVVNYGVNVHVEDPGVCTAVRGGPPPRGGAPRGR